MNKILLGLASIFAMVLAVVAMEEQYLPQYWDNAALQMKQDEEFAFLLDQELNGERTITQRKTNKEEQIPLRRQYPARRINLKEQLQGYDPMSVLPFQLNTPEIPKDRVILIESNTNELSDLDETILDMGKFVLSNRSESTSENNELFSSSLIDEDRKKYLVGAMQSLFGITITTEKAEWILKNHER